MRGTIAALKKTVADIELDYNRIQFEEGYQEERQDLYLIESDPEEKKYISKSIIDSNQAIQIKAESIKRNLEHIRILLNLIQEETEIKYSGRAGTKEGSKTHERIKKCNRDPEV